MNMERGKGTQTGLENKNTVMIPEGGNTKTKISTRCVMEVDLSTSFSFVFFFSLLLSLRGLLNHLLSHFPVPHMSFPHFATRKS